MWGRYDVSERFNGLPWRCRREAAGWFETSPYEGVGGSRMLRESGVTASYPLPLGYRVPPPRRRGCTGAIVNNPVTVGCRFRSLGFARDDRCGLGMAFWDGEMTNGGRDDG